MSRCQNLYASQKQFSSQRRIPRTGQKNCASHIEYSNEREERVILSRTRKNEEGLERLPVHHSQRRHAYVRPAGRRRMENLERLQCLLAEPAILRPNSRQDRRPPHARHPCRREPIGHRRQRHRRQRRPAVIIGVEARARGERGHRERG